MAARSPGGRPPANAALRGGLLIVLAVVIGVALMSWGFADEGGLVATDDPETTEPTGTDDPETTEPTDPTDPGTDPTDPVDGETQEPGDVLPPPRDPSEVGTLVLNGTDVNGAAGRVTQELSGLNYNVRPPDDAGEPVAETRIYHLEEWRAEAVRIAEELNVSTDVVAFMPVPTPFGAELGEASILIVLGEDQLISAAAAG